MNQEERTNELQTACLAIDCFPDEILAHSKVRIYIFSQNTDNLRNDEELTTDMWKDTQLVGLCTLHVNYLDHSPRIYVTNLLTRQVCFHAKTVLELKIQDPKWISFKFKEQDYTVGMRLLDEDDTREQFIAKFSEILLHKYRSEKENSENRKLEMQVDKIKLHDKKKRFSLTSIFRKSKQQNLSPRASIVPSSDLQHPENIRISMPKAENFSHVTHIEYDQETNQLVDVDPNSRKSHEQKRVENFDEIQHIPPQSTETYTPEQQQSLLEELQKIEEAFCGATASKPQLPALPPKPVSRKSKDENIELFNAIRERRSNIEGDSSTAGELSDLF
ncbi:hypothetical protein C9374_011701 [Naegleria lovaniensis]|uniref:Uncharacterized protein n=1 Tax=Naegleria lovaniensis TaxID=51637 RepID=A0AA88GGS9_NAELO|nr:uncharacterized protein C9374_011701 [Naegleria lovaniensis]KAG2373816.1 hypothetical protein C9374_011701 [Naegleria lovaniensis]